MPPFFMMRSLFEPLITLPPLLLLRCHCCRQILLPLPAAAIDASLSCCRHYAISPPATPLIFRRSVIDFRRFR